MKYLLLVFIGIFCFVSCETKNNEQNTKKKYFDFINNNIKHKDYDNISKSINDTILTWMKNDLRYWENEKLNYTLQVDSLKVFNKSKDKLVTSILARNLYYNKISADGITFLYGVKIKDKWYYFRGAHIVLPREYYQKDIHTALSFEKLHEIAMKEVFGGYLKKKDKGFWDNLFGKTEWEINDDFFSDLTSAAWCTNCKTQEQWNAAYLKVVKENWERKNSLPPQTSH